MGIPFRDLAEEEAPGAAGYLKFIRAQGDDAHIATSDSEICRWQLEHGTHKSCRAPIEIFAAAYGLYDLDKRRLTAEKQK